VTRLPPWVDRLLAVVTDGSSPSGWPAPADDFRDAAVLVLLGDGARGPDVLLTERAPTLRTHAGQVSFPGGARDPGDASATDAALREAYEEVGLDADSVSVLAELPARFVAPSRFGVVPVLAFWHRPHAVLPQSAGEVAAVVRAPLSLLADPAARLRVRHPSGYVGPAFRFDGLLVWGFTGGLLDWLLDAGGWAVPWDTDRVEPLP
jgi:8-oxo-dGTP pyrophosphatase MutT (NUDIX family)